MSLLALTTKWVLARPSGDTFEHLSVRDGLSHNSVNCILQDHDGFLWFGTSNGLNLYDGYTFRVFQPDPANPAQSFRYNNITGLNEDRTHRLWAVTTGGGLHEVDRRSGVVTPHPIRATSENRWNDQLSVYEDRSGHLWVSTYAGLARYEPDRHHFTLYPSPRAETPIKTVYEDRQHRFWVATYRGLYVLNRRTGRFTLVPAVSTVGGQDQPVFNSFYDDDRGMLWLGTAGDGLFRLDLRAAVPQLVPYKPAQPINRYLYMNSLHRDAREYLWVGTTEGLQRIDPVRNQVVTYRADRKAPNGISSSTAQAACHDRDGTLWVGTSSGIDRQTNVRKPFVTYQPTPYVGNANLPENKACAVMQDGRGQLWMSNQQRVYRRGPGQERAEQIPPDRLGYVGNHRNFTFGFLPGQAPTDVWLGTWDGLYAYDQRTDRYVGYPSTVPAQFLSRGADGRIWLGGEGGIAVFDPATHQYTNYPYDPADPTRLPDKFIYGLLASRAGDVWVAVKGKGISRLDPATGRFTHYAARPEPGQLNDNDVLAFYEDWSGRIWIGTNQGGLNGFDPRTGHFTALTTRNGLLSNHVVGIQGDRSGRLWVSTDKGLCRVDPGRNVVQGYTSNDGLPSNDFMENAVSSQAGRLFFGTLNGVVHFEPDRIQDDQRAFPVRITTLRVLEKNRSLTDSLITLPHDENFVSFEFAALTFTTTAENQYAHQLVGVDNEWVMTGARRFASYTSLAPGDYQFRVKAANSDGIWSPQWATLRLTIRPPWWLTGWAYGLYVLLLTAGGIAFVRFQTNRIRVRQQLELNRREAEQLKAVDELKTRFFTNITHEFRTPLSLIIGPVTELVNTEPLGSAAQQTLSTVLRNAGQLLQLINQLLDLAKLDAHHMPVALKHGQIADFVGEQVRLFGDTARRQHVTLTYAPPGSDSEYLFDSDKWARIIVNLLSNALKFTGPGGRVTVTLAESASEPELTRMQLVVSDTGIGIAPDKLPQIFDRFFQAEDSATRLHGGTGIGLALVRELTEVMGGTVNVTSQPGVGTTFRLHLPVRVASPTDNVPEAVVDSSLYVPEAEPVEQPAGEAPSEELVLVVDDNPDLRQFVSAVLAPWYRVMQAADGQEAWEQVQDVLPDLVVSDVMMPFMTGYELTQRIKTNPETDHIAVLLLTAKAAPESRVEGLERGADDYISKPFQAEELRLRVRNLIRRQQRLRERFWHPETPAVADEPDEVDTQRAHFLRQVNELLTRHLKDDAFNVEALAKALETDRRQLNRWTNTYLKSNPIDVIRNFRLHRAADLLRTGNPIAQTAYDVGFKSPGLFSTAFKKLYGKTPRDFINGEQK